MARALYPAGGISQRGYCNTFTGRLAQPPAAAASRVPAGQEPTSVPEPVDAAHSIHYGGHAFPGAKDIEVDRSSFSNPDRFHFCEGSSSDSDSRFPTGVNSPSFLESLRINTRIISTSSLSQLHVVVREEVKNMQLCALGSVNISSALHRATVLWKEHLEGVAGDRNGRAAPKQSAEVRSARKKHLKPIVSTLRQPLIDVLRESEHVQAYDIAISMWSLASLRMANEHVLGALSDRMLTMVNRLNATDMAHVMWACGSIQYHKSPLLLEEIVSASLHQIHDFKPCELSMLAWGMCKTNHRSRPVLTAAAERVVRAPEDFTTEELVRLVWVFTKTRFTESRDMGVHATALRELVKPDRLHDMLPQDHANLLWALAGLRVRVSAADLDLIANTATKHVMRCKSSELANIVYGFGSLMHQHDELLLSAADEVVRRSGQMSSQELCMVIWAFGKLGVVPEDGQLLASAAKEFMARMQVDELSPLTMSNSIKAFAKLEFLPEAEYMDALSASTVATMHKFQMAELSNLLWAYQQLEWADRELFERAEEFVIENMHLCSRHHVSSFVSSLKRSGYMCHRLVTVARHNDFHV